MFYIKQLQPITDSYHVINIQYWVLNTVTLLIFRTAIHDTENIKYVLEYYIKIPLQKNKFR